MGTLKRQNGASFLAVLVFLGLFAAVGLFGLKILPLYLDYTALNKAMDDLQGVANLGKQGKTDHHVTVEV